MNKYYYHKNSDYGQNPKPDDVRLSHPQNEIDAYQTEYILE